LQKKLSKYPCIKPEIPVYENSIGQRVENDFFMRLNRLEFVDHTFTDSTLKVSDRHVFDAVY